MRATIRDLASLSGLSTSTVSRVLTDNAHVSKAAREKVEQAIRQTGYVPNGLARGLVQKRRDLIAVIVPDGCNPYYDDIQLGIHQEASQNGFDVITISEGNHSCIRTVKKIIEIGIDGVLHLGALESDDVIPLLVQNDMPFVLLCRQLSTIEADTVLFNDYEAAFSATEHLIMLGHRNIAYICGRRNSLSSLEKYRGYAGALAKHGIAVNAALVGWGQLDMQSSYRVMNEFLDARASGCLSFTAVVAGNDMMGFGAREAMLERGLSIPDDLSLVSMDDISWSAIQGVEMTSVRVPRLEMGRIACQLLLKRIAQPERKHEVHILDTQLSIRKSCCPPKEQKE